MNFTKLLNFASEKQKSAENERSSSKFIRTQLSAPKKEPKSRPKGVQSAAVRAFLERKELEEKEKESQARQKKAELQKAREVARTKKRANAMASRTKDVPKVFKFDGSSGVDRVAQVKTEEQERIRREMQEKLQRISQKMTQVGGKFKSKSTISDDDYQSDDEEKKKQQQERAQKAKQTVKPERFKSKHLISDDDSSDDDTSDVKHRHHKSHKHHKRDKHKHKHSKDKESKHSKHSSSLANKFNKDSKSVDSKKIPATTVKPPKPKPKRRPQGPPPMTFEQMLAAAKMNQNGAGPSQQAKTPKEKQEESGRPLTQEEKEREARRNTKEYRQWLKFGSPVKSGNPSSSGKNKTGHPSKGPGSIKKPLMQGGRDRSPVSEDLSSDSEPPAKMNRSNGEKRPVSSSSAKKASSNGDRMNQMQEKVKKHQEKMKAALSQFHKPTSAQKGVNAAGKASVKQPNSSPATSGKPKASSSSEQATHKPVAKTKTPKDIRHGGQPSKQGAEQSGKKVVAKPQPQQSTWDRIYGHVNKNKQEKKKRVIESDDEEEDWDEYEDDFIDDDDDDMGDFIDDGPTDDYSKYIKEIFNYDKSKYRNERDDDLRDMEASFSRQMKEEAVSARIGYMEDLEDMKKEEEENKRKLMRQKAKKMKVR